MFEAIFFDSSLVERTSAGILWVLGAGARIFAVDFAGYFLAAGLVYFLQYFVLRRPLERRHIQRMKPLPAQIRRECLWSLSTVAIFAAIGTGTTIAALNGWTQIYFEWGQYGWGYEFASFVFLVVLHDAYFYWTHRAMHHRRLFAFFHKTHHTSHSPTPFSSYCLDPPDALVTGFIYPIAIFAFPLHPTIVIVFAIHQVMRAVLGHSGYELGPHGVSHGPWIGWITATTHHNLHHSRIDGNYAFYFTWWDRLMGTEITDYRKIYDQVTLPASKQTDTGIEA